MTGDEVIPGVADVWMGKLIDWVKDHILFSWVSSPVIIEVRDVGDCVGKDHPSSTSPMITRVL